MKRQTGKVKKGVSCWKSVQEKSPQTRENLRGLERAANKQMVD
jgi:hypothetical protein